jgi:3-oxoacyl-(acyl-carrier-protein) synthase/SAM-dependent methyltransferase
MPEAVGSPSGLSPVKQALLEIRRLRAQLAERRRSDAEPVAIIGMAVRLPGGIVRLEDFWQLLATGEDGIAAIPAERWDTAALYDADPDRPGKTYSRHGGFLADVDRFDAEFFGITPREAESMDPQHRILMELTSEALEHAGIPATRLAGSRTGVYIGLSNSDYGRLLLETTADIDAYSTFGLAGSVAAGRISYFLDAKGPSLMVDTACSSSLAAVHLACKDLAAGEASLAIVGAANLILTPEVTISFSHARMLARDGRCKTFDADANGYVRSEGCVVLVLKRLKDAEADGDRVLAVIRGSAVNHDGRSAGLTAPNGPAQQSVIQAALRDARLAPADIDYVEAHGTGTPLGDPIELQALGAAYGPGRPTGRNLLVGSVKTNIGHLEAAAGLAGLVKLVLSLRHEALPPHLHFAVPNSHVAWENLPVSVVQHLTAWPRTERPRRAGLSAFGFSGTNAHLILEEAPAAAARAAAPPEDVECLFVLSARSEGALRDLVGRYVAFLDRSDAPLVEICRAAAEGRVHHRHRLGVIARERTALAGELRAWLAGHSPGRLQVAATRSSSPQVGFFCPAMTTGDARAHALALAAASPEFRADPGSDSGPAPVAALQQALGRFWMSLGVVPVTVYGVGTGATAAIALGGPAMPPAASMAAPDILLVLGQDEDGTPHTAGRQIAVLGAAPRSAWTGMLDALRTLYLAGADLAWDVFHRSGGRAGPRLDLPTYAFQRQRYWRPRTVEKRIRAAADWPKLVSTVSLQSETGPLGWDPCAYEARWRRFDELTAGHAVNTLVALGEFGHAGARASVDDLVRRHGFLPLYRNLLGRWLSLLAREEVLTEAGGTFASPLPLRRRDLSGVWGEVERLLADDPDMLTYARRGSAKLLELLTGRLSPLEVLFARGSLDTAEGIYERSPSARYLNAMVAAAVRSALEDHRGDGPFRLVEAGAGTGGTTSCLAEIFPRDGEYWFTDLSDAFLGRARRRFGGNPAFRFTKFDLGQPPPAELPIGRADVVLAANVVHATKDVGVSLDHLRALLKPGGLLVLIESTIHHSVFDLTIGFIEGWSSFADGYRAQHPLLSADRWTALLAERGFVDADRFPRRGTAPDNVGQHVVIGRNSLEAQSATAAPAAMAAARRPVETATPPLRPQGDRAAGDRAGIERFVRSCAARVMHLDPATRPGLRERFSDLGMDSLMALQLKAELAEGLGLGERLPATIAFDTGTVEELTDQILRLLAPSATPDEPDAATTPGTPAGLFTAEDLEALSDEAVEALLARRVPHNSTVTE